MSEMAIFASVAVVCAICAIFYHYKSIKRVESEKSKALEVAQEATIALSEANIKLQMLESSHAKQIANLQEMYETRISEEQTRSKQMISALNEQEQKQRLELQNAFKALSSEILAQSTQSFNQQQMLSLKPLKDDIARFSKQLSDNHATSISQHASLETQINQLNKLSMSLSNEALNLTNALKGDNKAQGNWGEVILQKVLENSGLVKDREYTLQSSMQGDDDRILRPDAIVKLPKSNETERCVVIDAKTSLIAYERLCNAKEPESRDTYRQELSASLQSHIKNLSAKNYQQYLNGQKLDFVLMFIPIEGAFLEAMQADSSLYDKAYQKGVVLVSPTTIMAVLRIIHNLWQFEYRNKNLDRIFGEITKLFKRIEGFEGTLVGLGKNIGTMQKTYEDVMTKYNGKQGIANKSAEIHKLLKGSGVDEIADDRESSEESD